MATEATKPAPARLCLDSSADSLIELVLASLPSPHTRRSYRRAYDDLRAFSHGHPLNRLMLLRWRETIGRDSSSTANVRLTAVRKLAQEALRAEMISGKEYALLMSIKGLPRRGSRSGRWLTRDEASALLKVPDRTSLRGKRNYCVLAMLLHCALRRSELAALEIEDIQRREGRWVIADLCGKGGRVRTVPVPAVAKQAMDAWTKAAGITTGPLIRPISLKPTHLSEWAIWEVVQKAADKIGVAIAPHDLRRTCAKLCRKKGGALEQIQMLLGHASIQTTEIYLGSDQDLATAVNDDLGL